MAKSLRSKWRRKCRAVKRVRYGQKELDRLKKTLGIDESKKEAIDLTDVSEIATVCTVEDVPKRSDESKKIEAEVVEMETEEQKKSYNKGLRDKNGTYPVWMHQRKIKKIKTATNKKKKEKKRLAKTTARKTRGKK